MKVSGSHMGPMLQRECLSRFVHRFTKEHVPAWTRKEWKDGRTYPVQFASDKEWLDNTYFEVTVKGNLSNRSSFCESSPTWPDNPELRRA